MKRRTFLSAIPASLLAQAAVDPSNPRRLVRQFFYDKDRIECEIKDFAFIGASRGMAAGLLKDDNKARGLLLVTSNGKDWAEVPIREEPRSLFLLDESNAWMVGYDGDIWYSNEGGRAWRKMGKQKGCLRVHFHDEKNGLAVGMPKAIWTTADGGKSWKAVPEALQAKGNPEYTAFTNIAFVSGQIGMTVGHSAPPRRDQSFPDWMEPETASQRVQRPSLTLMAETRDGGKTWQNSETSAFGRVSRFLLSPDGQGFSLLTFDHAFQYSSELYNFGWKNGSATKRVFRQSDRNILDVAHVPGVGTYLLAIEPVGKLAQLPVPGRLKLLFSKDLRVWEELKVDYRATAKHAFLSVTSDNQLYACTDGAMILKLI